MGNGKKTVQRVKKSYVNIPISYERGFGTFRQGSGSSDPAVLFAVSDNPLKHLLDWNDFYREGASLP